MWSTVAWTICWRHWSTTSHREHLATSLQCAATLTRHFSLDLLPISLPSSPHSDSLSSSSSLLPPAPRTKRNLHSHRQKAPLTKNHLQVTGYGQVCMNVCVSVCHWCCVNVGAQITIATWVQSQHGCKGHALYNCKWSCIWPYIAMYLVTCWAPSQVLGQDRGTVVMVCEVWRTCIHFFLCSALCYVDTACWVRPCSVSCYVSNTFHSVSCSVS